jgi:hydroxyacylglutathione hydrolase
MLNVAQFRAGADNLSYLIYGKRDAIAIDGVACDAILIFLEARKLKLLSIANTHVHLDHTGGNYLLIEILIYHTPGHTDDSLCFHPGNLLLTGDTLFNGYVGNCFTGNMETFLHSIKRLMSLPDETVIYAGHDYLFDAMHFARRLEPDNEEIARYLKKYDRNDVFSLLEDERKVNPYLRFNDEKIIAILKEKGLPSETELQRWKSLWSLD